MNMLMCLVYVVDDEQAIRELVMDVLEEMGCTVYGARTGIDALTLLDEYGKPDLVITDLMMPIMNGQELCAYLRSEAETADVPIIVMTAASHNSVHIDDPCPPTIFKPFDLTSLEELVSNVLHQKQGHDFPRVA